MIEFAFLGDEEILVVKPIGRLKAEDFEAVARAVDPQIMKAGSLRGLMIEAEDFPGWEDFAGLVAHVEFVKGHIHSIRRIAVVSDSFPSKVLPPLMGWFAKAEIRRFPGGEEKKAHDWLMEEPK